eukprot:50359-Eustigmatos_ZCMA.PRE.1
MGDRNVLTIAFSSGRSPSRAASVGPFKGMGGLTAHLRPSLTLCQPSQGLLARGASARHCIV